MTSKTKKIIAAIVLVLILAVYFGFFYNRTIATVGDYRINLKDIKYRNKVHKVFYPNETQDFGKEQLIKAFTQAQILKNNGLEIDERVLKEEAMRIDQNTKAPEVLKKIKDIFKDDKDSYQKVFILPTYAERTIYFDFFTKSPKAQEKSLKKVQSFIQQFNESKKSLEELAREKNLDFKKFTLSKNNGIEWQKSQQEKAKDIQSGLIDKSGNKTPENIQKHIDQQVEGRSHESAKFWIENIIPNLKPGSLLQEPVDNEEQWMIVKYVKNLGNQNFLMEAVFIRKDSYQDWLQSEKNKIVIK